MTWSLPSRSQKNKRCGRGCERADSLNLQKPLRPSRAIRAGVQRRKQSTCTFLGKGGEGLKVEQQPVPRQVLAGAISGLLPLKPGGWGPGRPGGGAVRPPGLPGPLEHRSFHQAGFRRGGTPSDMRSERPRVTVCGWLPRGCSESPWPGKLPPRARPGAGNRCSLWVWQEDGWTAAGLGFGWVCVRGLMRCLEEQMALIQQVPG